MPNTSVKIRFFIIGAIAAMLLSIGIAEASGRVNDRQRLHRYYDEKAGIVCYAITNTSVTWWRDISCLPVESVKDIP